MCYNTLTLLSTLSSSIQWVKLLKTRWKCKGYLDIWKSSLNQFWFQFKRILRCDCFEVQSRQERILLPSIRAWSKRKKEVSFPILEKCCRQIRFSKYHQRTNFKFMLKRSVMSKPLIKWILYWYNWLNKCSSQLNPLDFGLMLEPRVRKIQSWILK